MSKLELRHIVRCYGPVRAVDDINIEIREGEFVSLLGPSGCGKTTTLRMIAGFVHPDEGTILMDGRTLSSPGNSLPPEKRNMSMIFQSYAIWPNMTVAENVAFGLKLRKMSRADIQRELSSILQVTRMEHLAERYPAELSGGQQQRVALARAIVVKPQVLLLDEPLSNLDANLREEMRFEIRRLHNAFGITTVYVTHDQGEAMATSDRIAVMNAGRIEQIDTPYAIYNQPKSRFVASFIGRTNLLTATIRGDSCDFGGFSLETRQLHGVSLDREATVAFSVRPQNLRLHPDAWQPEGDGGPAVAATIENRTYLGEHWDYAVRPNGAADSIRVVTLPNEIHDVGARVWLQFDPLQMVQL